MTFITESDIRVQLVQGIPNPYPLRYGDKLTQAAAEFLKSRGIAWKITYHSIPVGISSRHVHLSLSDLKALFGQGHELTWLRGLSQGGQFAAVEQVTIRGLKGSIERVRILGPVRTTTQVEISRTDCFTLGIHAPVRCSGDLEGTPGIVLVGPEGEITLNKGLIVAKAHVHMSPEEAKILAVRDGDRLMLQTESERPLIYSDVIARVGTAYSLDFHLDTDEGNAAGLKTGEHVRLIGVESCE